MLQQHCPDLRIRVTLCCFVAAECSNLDAPLDFLVCLAFYTALTTLPSLTPFPCPLPTMLCFFLPPTWTQISFLCIFAVYSLTFRVRMWLNGACLCLNFHLPAATPGYAVCPVYIVWMCYSWRCCEQTVHHVPLQEPRHQDPISKGCGASSF
jgi:hypothetical protein